ncbi:P-loop containing nucleoside triphosphate hydrolase protein [Pterulicium gracile]|uniref:P-loop containing nucleoside triphosphate hydrolase protein n=1 Tax=Pterulicium gracile TaxID=1884261 RepID=A0A5C3QD23_9AGAR|nr:P-loop containing nucleoside triphosphate hydrolase protein [Pterula gracilis]
MPALLQSARTDPEVTLLRKNDTLQTSAANSHSNATAPVITRAAWLALSAEDQPQQYGVLGSLAFNSIKSESLNTDTVGQRVYINTNTPSSIVVCGVQGSGKSHTVSTILESVVRPNIRAIGRLDAPLLCVVLHRGEGGPASRPSEAAFISVSDDPDIPSIPVRVLVSQSFLTTMRKAYATVGSNVTVEPLLFAESDLDAEAFLSLMAVGSSDGAPLYMQVVLCILREMGESFSYAAFTRELSAAKKKLTFNPAQVASLEQRLSLLTPFLAGSGKFKTKRPSGINFVPGEITIVDLSDPFIDSASACSLFNIVTRLFVKTDVGSAGKILLVDEAHKYLSSTNSGLTKTLLMINREQRHLGIRMIISTQEPTVIPDALLDLCPVAILHRFSSPTWWDHIKKHTPAHLSEETFDKIVQLQTGEAIVLAPSGLRTDADESVVPFGRDYFVVHVRQRVSKDGGASILCVE